MILVIWRDFFKMPVAVESSENGVAKNGGPESNVNSVQKPSKPSKHKVSPRFLTGFKKFSEIRNFENLTGSLDLFQKWKFRKKAPKF